MPKLIHSTEKEAELLAQIASGSPLAEACRITGVGKSTVYDWARKQDGFRERLERAEASRQSRLRHMVEEMGIERGDWRAPAWLLERTSPDYREQKGVAVHVERGIESILDAVQEHMSPEAYGELVDAVARVQGLVIGEDTPEGSQAIDASRALPPAGRSGSE